MGIKISTKIFSRISRDMVHAAIVFVTMMVIFSVWVHHSFEGNYWGPFLPGSIFGVPEEGLEIGMYPTSPIGWDAQFYYYQSNDIFGLEDAADHIDNPPYRYQRIGMPLIAGTVATVLGFKITPPFLYHMLQLLIMSLGFYFLIDWLKKNKTSTIYAYGWLLSVGVINGVAYGMPDPVGDAFFIMSVLFILEKRLIPYAIACTFLLLVREGYALFAATIFVGTFFNWVQWGKYKKWTPAFLTMLPGAIVVLWMMYVTMQFGELPVSSTKGANLTSLPLVGAWDSFVESVKAGNLYEVLWKEVGVFILGLAALLTYKTKQLGKTLQVGLLLYILLMASLGTTIWFDYSGYMKALGSIIAIIIIVIPFYKSWLLRIFIILLAITGVIYNYHFKKIPLYTEYSEPRLEAGEVEHMEKLNQFDARIYAKYTPKVYRTYDGIFEPFHRSTKEIEIRVENESDEVWRALPQGGLHSMHVSYHIYDKTGENLLYDGLRTPIIETIDPGEEVEMEMRFFVPPPGEYLLRISMLQEGVAWFYQSGDESLDIPIKIVQE